MRLILLLFSALIFFSCDPALRPWVDENGEVMAYVPVYIQPTEYGYMATESPKPTEKAGKIYAYNNYIFQNDVNKGIHVIDNSQAGNPNKIAFIKIPFSTEIAIKNSYLYTNSGTDLMVLNIQDPTQPTLVKKVENAFPIVNQKYPKTNNCYFECIDPAKGIVVDWEFKRIKKPNCRR